MNRRNQIRDAIKSLLLNQTSCGERIYTQRAQPSWEITYPAIFIFARSESAQPMSRNDEDEQGITKVAYLRNLEVAVEIRVKMLDDGNIDDALDDIAGEVERRVLENDTLGQVVNAMIYTGCSIEVDVGGEKPIGLVTMVYDVSYSD